MTTDKKLKKQIRERAKRTGESYATARRQTLAKRAREQAEPLPSGAQKTTRQAGATGAVSDAKCNERTGHGLAHWYAVLDAFDAAKKGHTAAARYLREEHAVSAWYSQGITVAYERERGLRAVNQTSKGYGVSISRVLPVPFKQALIQLTQARQRARWRKAAGTALASLENDMLGAASKPMNRKPDRVWWSWSDARGRCELTLVDTQNERSRVVVRRSNMPQHADVEQQRAAWRQLLDALRDHLRGLASPTR